MTMLALAIIVTSLLVIIILFGIAILWVVDDNGFHPRRFSWWRDVLRVVRNIVLGLLGIAGAFMLVIGIGWGLVALWGAAL